MMENDINTIMLSNDNTHTTENCATSGKVAKRKGRPFKGKCIDWEEKEDKVIEKRAIFRALKNIFQKNY